MSSRYPCLVANALLAAVSILMVPPLLAQTPPRPAVAVRQHPTMLRSVWPADFNRDGHVDFVAGEPDMRDYPWTPGRVVVRLGNGGGGVGQPIATGVSGKPAAVGDFNRDALIDVVAVENGGAMWILAGLGNGRFQAPRPLASVSWAFRFAIAAEMNGDGHLDLVIGDEATVTVRPGRGDLSFGAATTLPPGSEEADRTVSAGVAADLNRDGRRDLVVAQDRRRILIYLNTGSLLFTPSEIIIEEFEEPDEIHGLAAGDLNRDGRVDLVVPHAQGVFDYEEGAVDVLIGRGDGTFAPAVPYATGVNGPWTATMGDFNRDGFVDVAVGGQSWGWNDLSDIKSYWDSVAIFPGRGNGTLASAAVFRLDTRTPPYSISTPWVAAHHALHTADVNGDGHADLVASPLAILLNRINTPNRPPTADAGPDLVDRPGNYTVVRVTMTEPDWDWLRVEWRDETGRVIERAPSFEFGTIEDTTLTVTVTDARGATATDTVVVRRNPDNPVWVTLKTPVGGQHYPAGSPLVISWDGYDGFPVDHYTIEASFDTFTGPRITLSDRLPATQREFTWINPGPPRAGWRIRIYANRGDQAAVAMDISDAFTIDPAPAGRLPWPWEANGDTGAVGQAGSASFASGVFSVRGAGSGVGGTTDEFHFVDTSRFTSSEFGRQRFAVTARVTSIENVSALTRAGLMIRGALDASSPHVSIFTTPTSTNGLTFERRATAGGSNVRTRHTGISGPTWLKLVYLLGEGEGIVRAFARKNRTDAWTMIGEQTISFAPVHVMLVVTSSVDGRAALARFDNVEIDELERLFSNDVNTTVEGSTTTDEVTTTIEANGTNIWGRADSFRYHNTVEDLSQGGSITVRVRSIENTDPLAKAGVMIRNHFYPGAPHVSLFVTPGGQVRLQYRTTLHGESGLFASRAATAPEWLRLTRNGNVFTAFASNDGVTWTRVGAITLPMYHLTWVGLAVTSRDPGTLATAVFDDLVIRR